MQTAMQGVDVIGVGVSSAGIAWASEQIKPFARPEIPVVMISKGLEWDGTRFRVLPDTIRDGWPEGIAPAAIAGPCIAGELARRVETCVVLTGRETSVLERLRSLLRTDYYHLVVSPDVIGVEVSAALKNAYAMGIAFALGLHE
jgi:glycerol-3-phosphate dehydrogenase (NAD(P)+)